MASFAGEYGAPDAGQRRDLFDELSGIVEASTALERQAVQLL
ncbi:hypothetical protein AB0O67_22395 [Streptomyces sp. NPDC086077]